MLDDLSHNIHILYNILITGLSEEDLKKSKSLDNMPYTSLLYATGQQTRTNISEEDTGKSWTGERCHLGTISRNVLLI